MRFLMRHAVRWSGRNERWGRCEPAALVLLGLFLHARPAGAAETVPTPVRISEAYHEGCPKTPDMLARLEAHLGANRVEAAGADGHAMDLDIRIERRSGVSHGTLTLIVGGVSVERTASSRACGDVVAALAMMAAIAIGEETAAPAPAPTDPEPSSPVVRPSSKRPQKERRPERAKPDKPRASPRRDSIAPAIGAGIEVNGNRGAVAMPKWFAQVGFPRLPFEPTLVVGLARSARERISSSRGAIAVRWSEIMLAGCADVVRTGALHFGPCVNVEAGALEASVIAPLPVREFSYLWLSAGASAKIAWRVLPALSVEMTGGARASLVRSELFFEQDTSTVVYRAPPIVPFVASGFVAHLP